MVAFITFVASVVPAFAQAGIDSFLRPLGSIAEDQRTHLIRVTAITMIAILPVLIATPLILWRYHHRSGDGDYRPEALYRPDWQFSGPLEVAMWGVPFVIIAVLGYWLWHSSARLDPYAATGPDPLVIQAIGLDWKWLFIYPDQGFATLGEIAVPVGRPVRVELTTDSVMQSFRVSALAGQIYAMPGMRTEINFTADRTGTTRGENTQYSGAGFAEQTFILRALSADDWVDWVNTPTLRPLDASTYALLGQRSTPQETVRLLNGDVGPVRLGPLTPDLFGKVIARYHDGAPVLAQDQPGAPAYVGGENGND